MKNKTNPKERLSFEDKLRMRKERNENRGKDSEPADWETMDENVVLKLIAICSQHGCSISFGYTQDGGAYSISVYDWKTKQRYPEYASPNIDVDAWLLGLLEFYDD